jgi:hypothetical protein
MGRALWSLAVWPGPYSAREIPTLGRLKFIAGLLLRPHAYGLAKPAQVAPDVREPSA